MTNPLAPLPGDPTPAVTVIGTNLVIDYGDPEAARDAMERIGRVTLDPRAVPAGDERERLAALLRATSDDFALDDSGERWDTFYAGRLLASGVTFGDTRLREAARAAREFIEWWDSPPFVIADDDVLEARVATLRAALTDPKP